MDKILLDIALTVLLVAGIIIRIVLPIAHIVIGIIQTRKNKKVE